MRISDWSSDVCSSDLCGARDVPGPRGSVELADKLGRQAKAVFLARCHHSSTPLSGSSAAFRAVRLIKRRSEEHTSELQSLMRISYAVFCLKKKKNTNNKNKIVNTYTTITIT